MDDLWDTPVGRAHAEAIRAALRGDKKRRWKEEELRQVIRDEVGRLLDRDFEAEAERRRRYYELAMKEGIPLSEVRADFEPIPRSRTSGEERNAR